MAAQTQNVIFIDALCVILIFKQITHLKLMSQKNTDMNMAEIACFLSLLMGLRSHNTCNQGIKYMKIYRTTLCINTMYMQLIP